MSEQDPAALIAEVRFYSAKTRRVMAEINADPPQYVDYLDRLASALEAALADRARLREVLQNLYDVAHASWFADDGTDSALERAAMLDARAALAPDAKEDPTP